MDLKSKMVQYPPLIDPRTVRDPAFNEAIHSAQSRPDLGFDSLVFTYQGRLFTIDEQGNMQDRGAPPSGWFSRGPSSSPGLEPLAPQQPGK